MFGGHEVSYHQSYTTRDWLSILRTHYPTRNLQRKHRADTRKENNWKTEEALAPAAVTLETERIKWSNP